MKLIKKEGINKWTVFAISKVRSLHTSSVVQNRNEKLISSFEWT